MATNDITAALDGWIQPLLEAMSPAGRRSLNRKLAIGLRKRQQQRIAAQQGPDGAAFAPRRKPSKKGRIRSRAQMFKKMRQNRHLRISSSPDYAEVGFKGRIARIAQVHQEGLEDRVSKGGPVHRYAQRKLLGMNDDDAAWVSEQVIEHVQK